ncbi:hypothetical protein BJY04DRAFT_224587 [Aspergillus karnatakaensis]|uniref:pyrroline-5-carboxylate reductase family protein n=1 Tax=Aspergillus karnatakaensis TaxID=1810916 RepID=UPI003CCDF3C1
MALSRKPVRLTFLGGGHIGQALLSAILPSVSQKGSPISGITVAFGSEESKARLQKQFHGTPHPVRFVSNQNPQAVNSSEAILLAFPPDQIQTVLRDAAMQNALKGKTIISILARTPRTTLRDLLGETISEETPIIRAMPTIGTEIHESATLIGPPTSSAEEEALLLATWIFSQAGRVFHVTDDYFDTATGLSAFSNALTTVATQILAHTALEEGIPAEDAVAIAAQCIRGTASIMLAGKSPGDLGASLSAPGSITGQAIENLRSSGLQRILEDTLAEAIARAKNY